MKRNAIFLLGLSPDNRIRPAVPRQSQTKPGNRPSWTIDLYPTNQSILSTIMTNTQNDGGNEPNSLANIAQHTSDPGILHRTESTPTTSKVPTSLSASANILRRQMANYMSTIHTLPEEDEGDLNLTDQHRSLTEFAVKLCSKSVSQNIQTQPVLAFVIENHDLQAIRQEFEESIRRATALNYAFRVWNWLLKLVTTEAR